MSWIVRSIVAPTDALRSFVKIGSTVTYENCVTGRARTVPLVLPKDADIDENRMLTLAPVGAALLGMKVGQVFS